MHTPRERTTPLSLVPRPLTPLLAPVNGTDTTATLADLHDRLADAEMYSIGSPAAVDVDWSSLSPLLTRGILNNSGSSGDDSTYPCRTMEREVVHTLADLFRAPAAHRGHVSANAASGTLWSLYQARTLHPHAVVYHSQATHGGVTYAASLLGMPTVAVHADDTGVFDYDDLRQQIAARQGPAAVVVATIGTPMTEAHDDVRRIAAVLDDEAVASRWIHADAALSGIPLGLINPSLRPGLDFGDGADSIVVSGDTFLGTCLPCAVVIARDTAGTVVRAPDLDAHDYTPAGSRNGPAALMLWWALRTLGPDGLRRRAERSRTLAAYTLQCLDELGWTAFRHPNAFTVVLKTPPGDVADRWHLPTESGWSHIICMPGLTHAHIDAFIRHLTRAQRHADAAPADRRPAG